MNLTEFMKKAVEYGINQDPRGKDEIEKLLMKRKDKYEKMDDVKKEEYDTEKLWNPYSDSTILHEVETQNEIKKIMAGIDIDTSELILVDRLNDKNQEPYDLVLGHHPIGKGAQGLWEVMAVQADMFAQHGVSITVGEGLTGPRAKEVQRLIYPRNTQKTVDAAKHLGINLACAHSVADNHVQKFLEKQIEEKKPETLNEILKMLKEIPEFKQAIKHGSGPIIFAGSPENRTGKIAVKMTGGTSAAKGVYKKMSDAGVGTVIQMHIPESGRKIAKENYVNIIISGHMASDSLGMNLLLDKFEKVGMEISTCSGFIRVNRT
ncbi:MAG: NGG1p interacting factor NIF3 [Candidatus Hodarchaeales archaeon]